MDLITTYQLWRHQRTNEMWAVRLEYDMVSGVSGPLAAEVATVAQLPMHDYDDDPDQVEWFLRYQEEFLPAGR